MTKLGKFIAIALAVFAALYIIGTQMGCLTPAEAKTDTQGACTIVEAFVDNAVVDSVCAFAPELATLAAEAMAMRADSGARYATRCRIIPQTTTCATDAELLAGIRMVKAARR